MNYTILIGQIFSLYSNTVGDGAPDVPFFVLSLSKKHKNGMVICGRPQVAPTKKRTDRKPVRSLINIFADYGRSLLISLGNSDVSLMLFLLRSFMRSLSRPIPSPP